MTFLRLNSYLLVLSCSKGMCVSPNQPEFSRRPWKGGHCAHVSGVGCSLSVGFLGERNTRFFVFQRVSAGLMVREVACVTNIKLIVLRLE